MDRTESLIRQVQEGKGKEKEEAKETLVRENMGLVWCVVKRFAGRGVELEDLFQIGSIGLLKAIEKFDFRYQVKFSTYAVPMISGEIKRFLRDDGMIKVSRSLKELSYKIFQTREALIAKLDREPTLEELALQLNVEKEELVQAMESGAEVDSLHRTIYQQDGSEIRLMDKLVEPVQNEEKVLDHMLLGELLEQLSKEERQLIYLRYFAEETQAEIGRKMGISQVQVSRLEKKIMNRLKENLRTA